MAQDNIIERVLGGVRNELNNQWLGVDDFRRVLSKLSEGNVLGALKSGLAGGLELGGTIAAVLGTPFSGGASLAARGGLAAGTRLATKAPRIAKALQTVKEAKTTGKLLAGIPRQRLIENVGPLRSLQERMLLSPRSYLKPTSDVAREAMRVSGRNPLRALGIVDPYFNYKNVGTVGTGRIGKLLPSSPAAYTRGIARAAGLVPFAGQTLPSFALQRSVVPKMFEKFMQGPSADIGEGIVRTGINQLSQADLGTLLAAAELGPIPAQQSALEAYLRSTPQ